jgi:hypothetical protein
MKVRLKSHSSVPPGYFQFTIPQLGKKVWRSPVFSMLVRQFQDIAAANPHLGLPTDRQEISNRLDGENAMRISEIDGCFLALTIQDPPEHTHRFQTCYMAAGGRFGDLMIILSGLKHEFDSTGIKPVVLVGGKFSGLFDGISYADCWPLFGLDHVDNSHLEVAYAAARQKFDRVIVPKWWEVSGVEKPTFKAEPDLWLEKVSPHERDTYMTKQWQSCGWTMGELLKWPLVFDRRDTERENALIEKFTGKNPFVIFNFNGISSPFRDGWKILGALADSIPGIDFVDLGGITAERIYDLLGLFDRAVCLITIDTSTFHLSAASEVPTIHLQRSGHGGSLPRGNSILRVRYDEIENRIHEIKDAVENQFYHHGL